MTKEWRVLPSKIALLSLADIKGDKVGKVPISLYRVGKLSTKAKANGQRLNMHFVNKKNNSLPEPSALILL